MNWGLVFGLVGVAVCVIALFTIVGPYSAAIYRRTRMAGPVPTGGGPIGTGTAWGWFLSTIWSIGESKREEHYHYLRHPDAPGEVVENEIPDGELQMASDIATMDGDANLPRDHQSLDVARRNWWSGKEWVSANDYAPPSAERSVDGEQWWDGLQWQWAPNTFRSRTDWAPREVMPSRLPEKRVSQSWVVEQRGFMASRWVTPQPPQPDRSDPPPDWLAGQGS